MIVAFPGLFSYPFLMNRLVVMSRKLEGPIAFGHK